MDRLIKKALGLQMNGFQTEAVNIFKKASQKNPNHPQLCEYYGAVLASLGQMQEAKKFLKRALSENIEKPQVLNNLATVNRSLGLYEQGLLNVKSALKFKPNYTDAWVNCANIHCDLKQWDEAIACYKYAIDLKPKDPQPYLNLAQTYLHNSDLDKGLETFQLGQEKFTDIGFIIGELICYRAMSDYDKALNYAVKLKDQYDNEIMWFEWLQTLFLANKITELKTESQIAIAKFGEFPALKSLLELQQAQ